MDATEEREDNIVVNEDNISESEVNIAENDDSVSEGEDNISEKEDNVSEREGYIAQAVEKAKGKGFKDFRANLQDYEDPQSYQGVNADKSILPDFTANRSGKKHYFDIAMKTDAIQPLVTKWKLLNHLADLKNSQLILFAPRGHKAFAERLIKDYKITAQILAL